MTDPASNVHLKIYDRQRLVFSTPLNGTLLVGRQKRGEGGPFCRVKGPDGDRVIIANLEDNRISRNHALFAPCSDGRITITNRSSLRDIVINDEVLPPGQTMHVTSPAVLELGDKAIRLEKIETELATVEGLAHRTLAPGQEQSRKIALQEILSDPDGTTDASQLLAWMRYAMGVFQSAATANDFLEKAVQVVAELVGLDHTTVLLWHEGDWKISARASVRGKATAVDWWPSRTILERMRQEKRTFRQLPTPQATHAASLANVVALVSAPILDRHGEVIGALYGDRMLNNEWRASQGITEAEATLVDLLACSLAAGLARVEQEQAALAARVQFEEFFTPELARQLEAQPDLLSGRDMEVTILFCDISGFSRITERLGPVRTVAWLSDVMAALSDCVIEHQGVLVDYIGDELMAMWGAPVEQPDHAALACAAAVDMLRCLPKLNEKWQSVLGEPMAMGVGIDSGPAHVGNTGSTRKFKYGPLGNTVNLASRVQGATRHVKSNLLITGSTAERLSDEFLVRRLCQVQVVNIDEPVTLYQLATDVTDDWHQLKQRYEEALATFEASDLPEAMRVLSSLAADYPADNPTRLLLSRTFDAMAADPQQFEPIWKLPGK